MSDKAFTWYVVESAMRFVQGGFTLIELMIVVAIIGLLAAVALPAYQDYIARAQIAEAFTMVDGTRVAIEDYALTNGVYPSDTTSPSAASLSTTGRYGSAAVTPGSGTIVVTMFDTGVNAAVAGTTVTFEPPRDLKANTIVFNCTSTAKSKYLPKHCLGA